MTDAELERLALLWRRADPAERAMFEQVARRARLRARLIGYGDFVLFVVIFILLSVVVLRHWSLTSVATAIAILAVITWLNWRRRLYREQARTIDTSDRGRFLDTSITGARARLRALLLGLYLTLPLMLLTILFLISAEEGIGLDAAMAHVPGRLQSRRGVIFVLCFLLPVLWVIPVRKRVKAEIERLELLKRDYEEERRLDERS